jgi:hypothetical protein
LADDFQIRSEIDLDFVMFIRSAIATVAEFLSIVDLAEARRHRLPDGQIALFSQNRVHTFTQKYSA